MPRLSCLAILLTAGVAAGQPPIFVDKQHADLAVEYVGGAWRQQVRADDIGTLNPQTQDVRLVVNTASITTRPGGTNFNFIGVAAGQPIHRLFQTPQAFDQLYLGASTEQMGTPPAGDWADWTIPSGQTGQFLGLRVKNVVAPAGGHFSVWQNPPGGFGAPRVFVSTFDNGYAPADPTKNVLYQVIDNHSHFNFGFTQPGDYRIDVQAFTYYDAGGGPILLESDPDNLFAFQFTVVPVPEPASVLAVGAGVLVAVAGVRRRWKNSPPRALRHVV